MMSLSNFFMVGDNVNEAINYVLTRMAAERGITPSQMQGIIEEAIHAEATSPDLALRREMQRGSAAGSLLRRNSLMKSQG